MAKAYSIKEAYYTLQGEGAQTGRAAVFLRFAGWHTHADDSGKPYVICTGGEPLLQLDGNLITALKGVDFEIGVETNGTQLPPEGLDWICVSPKADAQLLLKKGHECKLVYPQSLAQPERFAGLQFEHFFLQPMDGPDLEVNTRAVVEYCRHHPQWRVSLQTHKLLGID